MLLKTTFRAIKMQQLATFDNFQKVLFRNLGSSIDLALAVLQQDNICDLKTLSLDFEAVPLRSFHAFLKKEEVFLTLLPSSIVFLHHKWIGTRLLSPNVEYTSCLTSPKQCKTKDCKIWGNFRKTLKMKADSTESLFQNWKKTLIESSTLFDLLNLYQKFF